MTSKRIAATRVDRSLARRRLLAMGVRPTRQRLDIFDVLFGAGDWHFNAEMIHARARSLRYPPSLATVYSTLHLFAQQGLLREIAIYGPTLWYDTKVGPHYHFYREDTDELFDIPEELVPKFVIPAPEGLSVAAIDVVVRVKAA